MDDLSPLPTFTRRRASRVQGPRPCSWMSPSSSSADDRDLYLWSNQQANLARGSTIHSCYSSDSSCSSASSSSFSSPCTEHPPNISFDYSAQSKPHSRHSHRRKPGGPRPAHDVPHVGMRPALAINTTIPTALPVFPQLQEQAVSEECAPTLPPPHIPPLLACSPTNFLLDWDAIFEVLGCSRAHPGSTDGSVQ